MSLLGYEVFLQGIQSEYGEIQKQISDSYQLLCCDSLFENRVLCVLYFPIFEII